MPEDIDSIAESLGTIKAGGDLSELSIRSVSIQETTVTLTVTLPSGSTFSHELKRPPVWGSHCKLKTLLDAYGLGPDEIHELEGKDLPMTRTVTEGRLEVDIDFDSLLE